MRESLLDMFQDEEITPPYPAQTLSRAHSHGSLNSSSRNVQNNIFFSQCQLLLILFTKILNMPGYTPNIFEACTLLNLNFIRKS